MSQKNEPARQPDIVFLFTDDQRFDTIGALGHPVVQTPNIDRLVREGVSFLQAHIPSGTADAICMPSRAMLHSGRTLFHLEGAGASIPADHTVLGETLQSAGYSTFGTGKWHNGPHSYARSFTAGGEIMFGGMADHWNVPMCRFDPTGEYDVNRPFILEPFRNNYLSEQHIDHIHFGRHSTDIISDFTVDFIRNHPKDKPYFSYTSFLAPHDPRSMPEEYRQMYDPESIELPANFVPEHPFDYGQTHIRDELLAGYPRTEHEVRRHIAEYYAMITHLDAGVGRIISAVEERGDYENTIFVFAGDNGLACGQHGLMGKQNHYEHSIRVPLIFSGPGIAAGETRDTYAYLLDIYPTLCDLLGLEIPSSVEGVSLVPSLENPDARARSSLYFAYDDLLRSVKDERHKLILCSHRRMNRLQLFDLQDDPYELSDLAAPQSGAEEGAGPRSEIIDRLFTELLKFRDKWDDLDTPSGQAFWNRFEQNGGRDAALVSAD